MLKMVSRAAKINLTLCSGISIATIYFVHRSQFEERIQLRKGIEKYEEKEAQKQINLTRLQEQQVLTEAYQKQQSTDNKER